MKAEKLSDSVIDRFISMALKKFVFKKVPAIADITPPIRSIRKIQELMAEDAKEIARMRGIMEADAIWWENEAKTYQDVINTQKQTINQLRQKVGSDGAILATITDERDRLHGLLSVADCPHCGGTAKDCEWCDGRKYCMEPRN